MKKCYYYQTSIGTIGIAEKDGFITDVRFGSDADNEDFKATEETPILREAFAQLQQYLSGERYGFDLPVRPSGTVFQEKVWECLCEIPYGQTRSYGEIARIIGKPEASRVVGMANNRNPIPIFVPCHRVIGSNGKLVGYAGGLQIKKKLLELERSASSTLLL
ncbi:MAG: methylated-DNA--[protein]-cysteine S-methyltransferase [Alistipes sp.]|nr:methylated-DNA--[protein]-cysteine S-methyltransferase [Alistipes sp.]